MNKKELLKYCTINPNEDSVEYIESDSQVRLSIKKLCPFFNERAAALWNFGNGIPPASCYYNSKFGKCKHMHIEEK